MGLARIQAEGFLLDEVYRSLVTPRTGGVAIYVGTVRGDDDGRRVDALHYEAYPEMAQAELEALRRDTITRFGLLDATILHRTGRVAAGQPVLLVAIAAAHRKEAFAALDHLMDRLKQIIPIWKQETGPEGAAWILGSEHRRVTR